jgi:hypothetical protein
MAAKYLAAAIIHRILNGEHQLLFVKTKAKTRSMKDVRTKFPAGTEDGHPEDGDVVYITLSRETWEETGLIIPDRDKVTLVHTSHEIGGHFRQFFFIEFDDCVGELRSTGTEGVISWVSAPFWITLDENRVQKLINTTYHTHRPALVKALERIRVGRRMRAAIA